jgi:3-mercaptopyruvate sulfurtransferase SseA
VRKSVVEMITREQLEEKMDRGEDFVLVDTLGEEYYRHSHLPGAIILPLEEIDRAEEVLPDKEADISFPKHKSSELEVPRLSDRGRHRAGINEGLSHY